jgi:hypothetical protein
MLRIPQFVGVSVLLASLSAAPVFAQAPADPRGGVEVGAGTAYLTVPKGTSRSMGAGVNAGLFAILPLTTMYKLQPEIQWEHRQSKVLGTDRTFDYITVPILVRMGLFKGIYIDEGPSFHMPVRAKVTSGSTDRDVKGNTKSDVSIVIGVGKRVGRVGVEGRWDSGIRRVQKTVGSGDVATRQRSVAAFVTIGVS